MKPLTSGYKLQKIAHLPKPPRQSGVYKLFKRMSSFPHFKADQIDSEVIFLNILTIKCKRKSFCRGVLGPDQYFWESLMRNKKMGAVRSHSSL
jgi:hypothetical protein